MSAKVCAYLIYLKNKCFFQPIAKKTFARLINTVLPLSPRELLCTELIVCCIFLSDIS